MVLGEEFQGLPLADLIGTPLTTACDANLKLAQGTADFINVVGFDGANIRETTFSFNKTVVDGNGTPSTKKVDITVPLLSIVQIPSLKIDNIDIVFDVEVKSSEKVKNKSTSGGTLSATAGLKIGLFNAAVNFKGTLSAHKDHTRETDKSAKYHIEVKASDHGMPEGLARVMDIMNQSIIPVD